MGLFDKYPRPDRTPKPEPSPAPQPVGAGDLGQQSGKISLTKGSRVTLKKTPVIRATASWASNTDYDLYALVLLRDGRQLVCSTFGSAAQPNPTDSVLNGAVRHLGDVVGGSSAGDSTETIEIRLTDEIEAIVPVAYSAQSNGTGSFRKYKVGLGVDNGAGDSVEIDARNANKGATIYTVAIAIIRNLPTGVSIEHLEEYSHPGSENRPAFVNGKLVMDAGARNVYK